MKKLFVALIIFALAFWPIPAESLTIIPTDDVANVAMDLPPAGTEAETFYHPRTITSIVIHHSGSFPYGPYTNADMWTGYKNYHMITVHPGVYSIPSTWNDGMPAQQDYPDGVSFPDGYNINSIDYNWGVGTDGLVYQGRPEGTVGWHASNWEVNLHSLGVCFIGNFDLVEPSETQYWTGVDLVSKLMLKYEVTDLYRHSDFATKSCPGYAFPWYEFRKDCRQWAGVYNDFTYSDWAHSAVAELGQKNIVSGFPDGNLYPNYMMTRAEFITIVAKAIGYEPIYGTTIFPDVNSNEWFAPYLNALTGRGIIRGYADGTFRPNEAITRAEAVTIIAKAKAMPPLSGCYFKDVQPTHWAYTFIYAVYVQNIVVGYPDGTFKPDNCLTRAEGFTLVSKII